MAKVSTVGMAIPGLSAVVAGAAGLASGAVAAGLAVKAFQTAAMPQLESVTGAWDLYSQAQDAAAKGGASAKATQEAYSQAMAKMTPATRDTAEAFIGLKKDFGAWSDSLSGTTMPVFTKGIEVLRDLLPTMTPFVEAAAGALGSFVDEIAAGTKSAGFKQWAADMSNAAGPALTDFLTIIKNLAIGFGGLLQAFLPVSSGMTGGLAEMSAAFADWGAHLKDSDGFAQFMDMASTGGDTLGNLAGAAVNLFTALAPVLGTTAMLANGFAKIVNATPAPVLTAVASALVAVRLGMLAYSAVTTIVAARNAIMAASQTPVILGWLRMNAVGVAAMLRIAATSTVSAATTAAAWAGSALASIGTWIAAVVRAAITSVAQFTLMAARAVAWATVMAAQWLVAMGPVGWVIAVIIGLVALVVANWSTVKRWTVKIWGQVVGFIRGAATGVLSAIGWLSRIPGQVGRWFGSMKDTAVRKASEMVSWMRGLPGRLGRSLGNMGRLLVSKGADVVRGLWNGIASMGGWLWSRIKSFVSRNVVDAVKGFLLIGSPSKLMANQVGQWIPAGIAVGAEDNRGVLDKTMAGLVDPQAAMPSTPRTAGMAPLIGAQGGTGGVMVINLDIGGRSFGQLWVDTGRRQVRALGGDVQAVIGQKA